MSVGKEPKVEYHKPVLFDEVMENIISEGDAVYVDCTLGGGGHTEGMLERSSEKSKVIGIDQDKEAINFAKERLKKYGNKIEIFQDNFRNLDTVIYLAGYNKVDRILMDIGVSSNQLDNLERGFSYRYDAKLDMRMDRNLKISAYEVVNDFSEKEIADIIYKYGEEPKSRKIAKNIVEYRKNKKIETTLELSEIIIKSIGKSMKKHPSKRTFQAIRIFVNRELEVLEEALDKAVNLLNNNGKLLVITFHSLEDRMVKEKFREYENPCTCPPEIPVCVCNKKSLGKVITKKPIIAKESELNENNRAHSAKLRIFERKEYR
jgi:S-adenosyl-methyltransferase mraW